MADTNLRAFLDGGDAAREGEEWLQSHITDEMRRGWPNNSAKVERYQCGGDNHMAVLWLGLKPLASYTVLRDDFNRSKLLLWDSSDASAPSASVAIHAPREFVVNVTMAEQPQEAGHLTPLATIEGWAEAYSNPASGQHFQGHGMVVKLLREYAALRRSKDGSAAAGCAATAQPLTDDEIDQIAADGMRNVAGGIYATSVYEFARAIEARVRGEGGA